MAGLNEETFDYTPDYAVRPGETLRETLEALDMSQRELAERTGLSTKTINQIVGGTAPLTQDTALKLEQVTGVPARMWNSLETNYRERLARLRQQERLADQQGWVDELPLPALRQAKIITRTKHDRIGVLQEFLAFFGVADRDAWQRVWGQPAAAFRQSPTLTADPVAVAAWLRQGELEAGAIDCAAYDEDALKDALAEARSLMSGHPHEWHPHIVRAFAAAGVALVVLPEVKGARAFGASRWLTPRKAIVQLSLRRKWEDEFWFSLFHEACHVLKHPKKNVFVSNGDPNDGYEHEANLFAARLLIPKEYEDALRSIRLLSEVEPFARKVGVPPGVVVGRLQHDGIFPYSVGHDLRRKFEFARE
ncbi:MAG: HigA family addiction module antitoxin [Egibacteraceae bacterium]